MKLQIDRYGHTIEMEKPEQYTDGGYPLVYYSKDGSEWCHECAAQDAEPPIFAVDTHLEGEPIICDGCGKEIASAYGEVDDE